VATGIESTKDRDVFCTFTEYREPCYLSPDRNRGAETSLRAFSSRFYCCSRIEQQSVFSSKSKMQTDARTQQPSGSGPGAPPLLHFQSISRVQPQMNPKGYSPTNPSHNSEQIPAKNSEKSWRSRRRPHIQSCSTIVYFRICFTIQSSFSQSRSEIFYAAGERFEAVHTQTLTIRAKQVGLDYCGH